jgi:transposase InsO family protein
VDTGAEISVLSIRDCQRYTIGFRPLERGSSFSNFDGSQITMMGQTPALCVVFNNKSTNIRFYVADVNQSILGMDAISGLRLTISFADVNPDSATSATALPSPDSTCVSSVSSEKHSAKIRLLPSAPDTIVQRVRRLPFALEEKVERELRQMVADDVIEAIESSRYVSPIVVVPKKSGNIRLCVDFRKLNSYIVPDPFPVTCVDDLLAKVKKASMFSVIDLKAAFHQIPLHVDSRDYTAFVTHLGTYRFKKLPFGLANSPAIFNRIVSDVLRDIPNVLAYFDDVLVFGESQTDHDLALKRVEQALRDVNLDINTEKSIFSVSEVEFLGRHLSSKGIQPSVKALDALKQLPDPTSKKELHSFLGMMSYFRSFVVQFSDLAAPLYALLKDDVPFSIGESERDSISSLRNAVLHAPILGYFDNSPDCMTILTTDASRTGLGGMLSQVKDGVERPIYFISRKLSQAETKYSVPELETLAVIWGVERLSQYLHGRSFTIRTDHSSLRQVLTGKMDGALLSARVTRWAIRLMGFNFTVEHISGAKNVVADCLSRMPLNLSNSTDGFDESSSIMFVSTLPVSLGDIRCATASDEVLLTLSTYVQSEWPDKKRVPESLRSYYSIRDSLSLQDGVVFRGERIVVPQCLQKKLIDLAHEFHFGLTKTKMRLRLSYWWPGMDSDVDAVIRLCHCCKIQVRDSPVQVTEWNLTPWSHLAMDIAGPKTDANGKSFYVLALIDMHSKYVCAKVLPHVKSEDVIDFLQSLFMTFGLCNKITTDNGSQFSSELFTTFLRCHGISHVKSSIYNPMANGSIERVNRNLKKILENAKIDRVVFSELNGFLQRYLFSYNNTVHETISDCPSKLLFRYSPRTFLHPIQSSEVSEEIKEKKEEIQRKIEKKAEYANETRRPRKDQIFKIGDWVQKPPGPIRRIVDQIGPYTFKLNDGYTVNSRRLRLIKRPPPAEYAEVKVKSSERRYPVRNTVPPDRYGFS